jgi:hypothetical protein
MATTGSPSTPRKRSGTTSSATKKAPAKKSSVKKVGATKDSAKKSAASDSTLKSAPASRRRSSAPHAEAERPRGATRVAGDAARQLGDLTGKEAEGVVGLERSDGGWTVQVEIVEVRRIPNTTDVLALYEVQVDGKGELQSYRRIRRYARGVPGED